MQDIKPHKNSDDSYSINGLPSSLNWNNAALLLLRAVAGGPRVKENE